MSWLPWWFHYTSSGYIWDIRSETQIICNKKKHFDQKPLLMLHGWILCKVQWWQTNNTIHPDICPGQKYSSKICQISLVVPGGYNHGDFTSTMRNWAFIFYIYIFFIVFFMDINNHGSLLPCQLSVLDYIRLPPQQTQTSISLISPDEKLSEQWLIFSGNVSKARRDS